VRVEQSTILSCSWTSPPESGRIFVYANIFFECGEVAARIERVVFSGRARSPGLQRSSRAQEGCIYVMKVIGPPVIESMAGLCRFYVLSRCRGRSGKSYDFHGCLTKRAFENGSWPRCPDFNQDLQNHLKQRQEFFGVAM